MPFPALAHFCSKPDLTDCQKPPGLRIRMPGGGVITAPSVGSIPSPSESAGKLLASVNAALIPLTPIFDILEIIMSLMKVLDAVKSLNPVQIASAIAKLVPKVAKILQYVPPLSVPIMVKDILKVIICLLSALEDELFVLAQALARANLALSKSTTLNLFELREASLCMLGTIDFQFNALASGAEPLNRLIAIINTFLELVGMDPLPQLEGGGDIDSFLAAVTKMRVALEVVYSAIPG